MSTWWTGVLGGAGGGIVSSPGTAGNQLSSSQLPSVQYNSTGTGSGFWNQSVIQSYYPIPTVTYEAIHPVAIKHITSGKRLIIWEP